MPRKGDTDDAPQVLYWRGMCEATHSLLVAEQARNRLLRRKWRELLAENIALRLLNTTSPKQDKETQTE